MIRKADTAKKVQKERVGESVTIHLRGRIWWCYYQLDGKQQRESLKTANKKEARRAALLIDADLIRGIHDVQPEPVSLNEAIDQLQAHLEQEGRAAKTLKAYRHVFRTLIELAGERRISKVHQVNLRFIDYYREQRRTAGRAPKTIWKETAMIRRLVRYALSRKLILRDPLEGLQNPQPRPTEQPCWSPAELEQIIAAAEGTFKRIYILLADTGMRLGELQWLTWDDFIFSQRYIHIRPKEGWSPKTGESRRVPMTERVYEEFHRLPRTHHWVFTRGASIRYPDGGQQISPSRTLRSLKRLLKRIGLPEEGKLHTFRHSFISKALAKGIPATTVRSWVGHVSDEMLRRYTHVLEQDSRAGIERFAAETTNSSKEQTDEAAEQEADRSSVEEG
ncbi:site-specific tyrosine recombinase XerC [Gimesia panareensis]|uniref:Site-specific tyrosine recombinase XerC n=1 Tax=Gimesia panareensis TaxID=2527978 RepID=A0A518FWK6_9PLAN|nr:site-specific integrase [Gimesia panareensis]QDV19491.1 site-specific tyrosine recombinase XerC [Gimesia panareensis]QDV20691.1 site-specific tyrosine recombinase XerC [Gimesia panareensis]